MQNSQPYTDLLAKLKKLEEENAVLLGINQKLSSAVENSPATIVITDKQGIIEYVNPHFTKITGYTEAEAIGMHTRIFKSGKHSDDFYKKMWQTISSGEVWKGEFYNKKKNGELYWENEYIAPIKDTDGSVNHYVAIKIDITQQKENEEKIKDYDEYLRAITQAIPELIFVFDEDGRCIDIIASNEKLLYTDASKIKGQKMHDIMPPDIADNFLKVITATLKSNETQITEYELNVVSGNKWFEGRTAPLDFTINKKKCIIYAARETTEHKLYETQLKELIATKDKFFSIIAHDLKNLFSALLGISEIFFENPDNYNAVQIKDLGKMMNESTRNAFELLDNLLQWSRSQSGRLEFEPQLYKLRDIVDQSIKTIESQAINKKIMLANNVDEQIEVFADINLLKTVIRNLTANGVKFTDTGGSVLIFASSNNGFITVTVKDTGVGIPDDAISKLFRIDTKLSTSGTANEKGTGLGLILCKEFVEIHKGTIWVESEVDKGSEFKFTLPKKHA